MTLDSLPVRYLAALLVACVLAGCATVGPDYRRPEVELPATFAGQAGSNDASVIPTAWWTLYDDPVLTELVAATLRNNVDLARAAAQIEEAEALLAEVGSNLLPELDLTAGASRARSSTRNAQQLPPGTPLITNARRVAISTSFEIDFWGKFRRAAEGARAQLIATRYGRDVVALTLVATTVQAYFTARSLDAQIAVTRDILTSRDDALTVAGNRARGGLASDLDVNQAQGARADAALQLAELQRQRAQVEHQLGTLTGNLDLALAPGDLARLPVPATPPPGLPSSLVERRPDVHQAEEAVVSANAQIGVARAAELPTFSLTGSLGLQSSALGNLLRAGAQTWSIGPSLVFPILDAGKYAARTRQAEARHRQAVAAYAKALETAYREVSDALTNLHQARASVPELSRKVEAARNALRLSRLRYEAGYAPFLDVLDAQRTQNAAELALVQNRQAQLVYSVDLMRALGGGWNARDADAARNASLRP
ncbi:MAG: efflux transporter outer membrane subunit [Casimicrobiaceae bacterium]